MTAADAALDRPALAPLRALLLGAARRPALGGLAGLLRGAGATLWAYREFRRLVLLLFSPLEGDAILGDAPDNPYADYDGRCRRFAARFTERWFDLYDPDAATDDCDEGLYSWIGGAHLLAPMGPDYEALEHPAEAGADPALLLLVCLLAPDLPGQEARLDALLGEGLLTPELAGRLARPAPPLSVIRAALPAAWREFGAHFFAWLYRGTTNRFLLFAFDEEGFECPEVGWCPDEGLDHYVELRREYREALAFHERLAALEASVRADPDGFVAAVLPGLEDAQARYFAGELPLVPGSPEEALARVVARLSPDDEAAALHLWGGGSGDRARGDDGLAETADVVDWQLRSLFRHLEAAGVPLARGFGWEQSAWRLAEEGVLLGQEPYRPPAAQRYRWDWERLPPLVRALFLLSGGAIERSRLAAFRREHPALAAAISALRDALKRRGAEAALALAESPFPELPPYLAWLQGGSVGDPLLDPWGVPVRRVALAPETIAAWAGATARAGARLAAWERLRHALAGEDGEDEPRLVAALRDMTAWLGGATDEHGGGHASVLGNHDGKEPQ